MLRNLAAIEVLNPKIVDNLEQKSEAKQGEINPISRLAHTILHRTVNPEYVKRLDNQVDNDEKKRIDEKFSIHVGLFVFRFFDGNKGACSVVLLRLRSPNGASSVTTILLS